MLEDVKVGLVEAKGAWQPHGSRSYTKRRLREAPIRFRRRRRCGRAGRRAAPCAGRGPCRSGRAACRPDAEIGRATCRAREGEYVEIREGAVELKKKKQK